MANVKVVVKKARSEFHLSNDRMISTITVRMPQTGTPEDHAMMLAASLSAFSRQFKIDGVKVAKFFKECAAGTHDTPPPAEVLDASLGEVC